MNSTNEALNAEKKFKTSVEEAQEYIENFDILETINNVGNDEVFTPVKVCQQMLDVLPNEVWHNPDYKWLNPCDKNGVFLREIALRLDAGLSKWENDTEKRRKHILQKMIFSIGLTKFTSQVSRRTVYYCSQANRKFDGKVDQDGNSINGYAIGNGEWFDSEQGNILTPITEHTFNKGKCIYCGTAEKDKDGKPGKYSDPKQIEHYAYEFIHVDNIENHLQKIFFGGKQMKFDIIIGNPPYQLSTNGGSSQARPLYHRFVNQAKALSPKYIAMIIPSRWFAGGMGLDNFRESMLNDGSLRKIVDYPNAKECFPNTSIGGGVNYFLWDRDHKGPCEIINVNNGKSTQSFRKLNEFDVFVRNNEAISIIHKVMKETDKFLPDIVSSLSPFGIGSAERGSTEKSEESITLFSSEGIGYISPQSIKSGHQYLEKYKVMVSKTTSEHANEPSKDETYRVLSTLKVLKPKEVCTFSYFIIGCFTNQNEANNLFNYLQTRFVRFLILQAVSSINLTKDKFRFVPLQAFTKPWTEPELYAKYGLTREEINYIEKIIQKMGG